MPAIPTRSRWSLSAWCVAAAFGAYFCTYAFRKPFTAARFDEPAFGDIQMKTLLVTAQVIGYTASKFLGIKFVAEMHPSRRIASLLVLIASAEVALLLFAVTPAPFNCIFLFLNGLPLGMVFSLVLGFLEGRRHTEALTAGLCTSFIVAGGVTKSVGAYLLDAGISEWWMPFCAGLIFVPPMLLFLWMLSRIPAPSAADIAARTERAPMFAVERRRFYGRHAVGLTLMMIVFMLVTVLRSVRDDFAPEIWRGLGVEGNPSKFAVSESIVGVVILILAGLMVCVRDNRRAFFIALAVAGAGAVLLGAVLLGLHANLLSPMAFMVLHGLGLYIPYVLFHTTLFERLIAMTRDRGTIGYLMCVADATGYLGYAALMLGKNFVGRIDNFLTFFIPLSWFVAGACVLLLIPCWRYFAKRAASKPQPELQLVEA